jgi:hypothetical protein
VIRIIGTDTRLGADGGDSMLLKVPGRWYADLGQGRTLVAAVVHRALRGASERGAAAVGRRLHHADWVITGDPAQVEQIGMTHDCGECRAGTDRALAWLAGHPGGEIAAGMLHWTAVR